MCYKTALLTIAPYRIFTYHSNGPGSTGNATIKGNGNMISNERPSGYSPSFNDRSFNSDRPSYQSAPLRPRVDEDTLKTETIQIERKTFILTLKENPRGRFLRITEDVNGRRDNVIVPSTGLEDFARIVTEMAQTAGQTPSQPA